MLIYLKLIKRKTTICQNCITNTINIQLAIIFLHDKCATKSKVMSGKISPVKHISITFLIKPRPHQCEFEIITKKFGISLKFTLV